MKPVRELLGRKITIGGQEHVGWLPESAARPLPTPTEHLMLDLQILGDDQNGFLLQWEARDTSYSGDTWHQSIEDAIEQARLAFGIAPEEWRISEDTG